MKAYNISLLMMVYVFCCFAVRAQKFAPVKSAPAAEKAIALTFDDGIDHEIHQPILDLLKKDSLKVTFFMIGNKVTNKKLVKRTLKEGHEIDNHSMTHSVLPNLSTHEVKQEIVGFNILMQKSLTTRLRYSGLLNCNMTNG